MSLRALVRADPIRPFRTEDMGQVVGLFEQVFRSGSRAAPPGLAAYFQRTLLDQPWADPEIPSLVYQSEDDRVVGFVAAHIRRLRFHGRRIRVACGGQLMADPTSANRAVGALLLRRFLAGPQDLTITDSATTSTQRMWKGLGGRASYARALRWVRLLRPWGYLGDRLLARLGSERLARGARPLWAALDGATDWVPGIALERLPAGTRAVELTPDLLLECLESAGSSFVVRPDYDRAFLEWLFEEMSAVRVRGRLVKALIRDRRGMPIGWFVYYLNRGGVGEVMQIGGTGRGTAAAIDHLLLHARAHGATAVVGRLEPALLEPLSQREIFVRPALAGLLVHSQDPALLLALESDRALLSRMEGETWMGYDMPFR